MTRRIDPRTRPVPPELVELVQATLGERGVRGAADSLGISTSTLTSIAAGQRVMPGTLALLQLAAARREAA